jgi:hypothetical protein
MLNDYEYLFMNVYSCIYIGLSGYAQASNELRAADKIVTGYDKITLKDIYGASKRALKNARGPEQQSETASSPILSVTRSGMFIDLYIYVYMYLHIHRLVCTYVFMDMN